MVSVSNLLAQVSNLLVIDGWKGVFLTAGLSYNYFLKAVTSQTYSVLKARIDVCIICPFPREVKVCDNKVSNLKFILYLECSFRCKVVAAMEINTTANQVYQHNFGDTVLLQKNIEVS